MQSLAAVASQSAVEKMAKGEHEFVAPSHKADLWRYSDMYENGGVYLDMKIAVLKPLHALLIEKQKELMEIIQNKSKGQAQAQGSDGQATASENFNEPFFLAAIGQRKDRIFQGCLACSKRHPLMMEALVDTSLTTRAQAKASYLKFCKYSTCSKSSLSILRTNKCNVDGTTVVALDGSICCKKQKQMKNIVIQKRKTKSNVMGTILKILQRIQKRQCHGLQRGAGAGIMASEVMRKLCSGFK